MTFFLAFCPRKLVGGDVTGPKGVWWNDASLTAEVNSAEGRLSSPTRESTAGREQAETTEAQVAAASEGSGLNAAGDERFLHLPERGMEETWDRFTTGGFLAPDLELNQSARPCTPPNLARTIQVRRSSAIFSFLLVNPPPPLDTLHRFWFWFHKSTLSSTTVD